MIKNIILLHNKEWFRNAIEMLHQHPTNTILIFENHDDVELFVRQIKNFNNNLRKDCMGLIPIEFDHFVIPTEGSLLHRRLLAMKYVLDTINLKDNDRIMFTDEDDRVEYNERMIEWMNPIKYYEIDQFSRLDYKNIYADSLFGPWTKKDNEWEHYTIHSGSYRYSVLYSYNYNFTGKLFPVKTIRDWLNKEYENLMKMGKLMEQEDLILTISLINTCRVFSKLNTGKYGIYKYNYVSKNRQDPSKNPIILDFISKNINKESWEIEAKDFPFKNKYIACINSKSAPDNERCCYLKLTYEYPWDYDLCYSNYVVMYNQRKYNESDLYRIMIEKSKKYNLEMMGV